MIWKHYLSALLTLGTTQWDVISDIWNGVNYLAPKNVTRQYVSDWYPEGVPEGCILFQNNEDIGNRTIKMECLERDQVWGGSSIGLVQAPMLLGGQFVVTCITIDQFIDTLFTNFFSFFPLTFLIFLLSLTIPFPLVVLAAQTIYILKPNQQINNNFSIAEIVIILVSLEAAAEAGPQALLQLYILLSDYERIERGIDKMTILSLVSSVYTISKASITMFSSETASGIDEKSLSAGEPSPVVGCYSTVIRFLPVFCTSIIFRVSSSCITLVLLRSMGFIPLAVGAVTTTVLSAIVSSSILTSLQHGFGGIAVLVSSSDDKRDNDKTPMMISSVVWLITHSTTLLVIAAVVATPQYHLQHWRNTARIPLLAEDKVHILYIIIGILILVGILNVFLVWFQIVNNNWAAVNKNIEKRMKWIRGEEHGVISEVGSVEPHLQKVVDKIVGCWTSCKTQTLECCKEKCCCCCNGDIEGKMPDGNVATTQEPNFVPAANGEIPANAFPVNVFKGETFYLARANCDGFKMPGYLVPSKGKVFVSWGLKSVAKKEYEVLVESGQRKLYWVDSTKAKGNMKALGAVSVGTKSESEYDSLYSDSDTLYVGRAKVNKEWLIGKINPRYNACFIASHKEENMYGDLVEQEVKKYEVLCSKPTTSPEYNIETKPKLVLVFE